MNPVLFPCYSLAFCNDLATDGALYRLALGGERAAEGKQRLNSAGTDTSARR